MADWRNRIIERRVMRIGDIRPNKGNPRGHPQIQQERMRAVLDRFGIVSDTIAAFQDAGATLYNEAILVTAVGSLPIRVSKQFEAGRKLGKTHQNVLVFCKGDPRKATEAVGAVEAGEFFA